MILKHFGFPCTALLLVALSALRAPAQSPFDDPFGGSSSPAATGGAFGQAAATADTSSPQFEEDLDPIIRIIRSSPPKTPTRMAEALTWVTRLKRWDEAKRLLDATSRFNWNLNQSATLAKAASPALWFRLRQKDVALNDAQKQLVNNIISAPGKLARSPQAIDSSITKLFSAKPNERAMARLRLQDGGASAVERLVYTLVSQDNAPNNAALLVDSLVAMGNRGVNALRAATVSRSEQVSGRALKAIADSQAPQLLVERAFASALTGDDQSIDFNAELARELTNYRDTLHQEPFQDLVWRAKDGTVQATSGNNRSAQLERVAQLATMLFKSPGSDLKSKTIAVAVLLERAYQQAPGLAATDIDTQLLIAQDTIPVSTKDFCEEVFNVATQQGMHGAALRSVQLATQAAKSGQTLPPMKFLSDCLHDTRPVIRYEALASIARIDPVEDYRGSAKAVETAIEMSRLRSGPLALVIGLQSQLRQAAANQFQIRTGGNAIPVNSARAALIELADLHPYEMIFIVDRVADQSIFELLQRLRKKSLGRALPIGVLTEELYRHERELIDSMPDVHTSILSRSAEQMPRLVESMNDSMGTLPLTSDERAILAIQAANFLSHISSARESYDFYPLELYRRYLESERGGLSPAKRISLLSGVRTASSQFELADMTGNAALSKELRIAAAKDFANSINRFGTLLSKKQVIAIYDRYNEIGPTDPTAVQAMGQVLDAIEARADRP